ncbi:MAG TPA: DUF6677 family protein [Blastocatellia bacterium]|nr:DUF6677 family protein [Blastocatellia bacterium]
MQSKDGVGDKAEALYIEPDLSLDSPRPFPVAIRAAAVVLSWLVPGAGHLVLGKYRRAVLFLTLIGGSFVFGLILNGRLFWPVVAEPDSKLHFDLLSLLWFFAQIGSGLCYLVSYALGIGTTPHPEAATYDYGNTFTFLAGLLNYLVIHDAFDIGAGRKR